MTPPAAAGPRASWRQCAGIVAIFVAIGPLVGLLAFGVAMALRALAHGQGTDSFYLVPFFLIYGLLFAHFVGGVVAAAAGVAIATLARWRGTVTARMAALVGAAAWLAWNSFNHGRLATQPVPADDLSREMLAVMLAATLACWRLCVAWVGLRR